MIFPVGDKPRALPREYRRADIFTKRESTALTNLADRLAKDLLIHRVGGLRCEACGAVRNSGRGTIDRAHGFGKKARPALRWDRRNLVLLDRSCHEQYGRTHRIWLQWLQQHIGPTAYEALLETARHKRRSLTEIVVGLKAGKFSNE